MLFKELAHIVCGTCYYFTELPAEHQTIPNPEIRIGACELRKGHRPTNKDEACDFWIDGASLNDPESTGKLLKRCFKIGMPKCPLEIEENQSQVFIVIPFRREFNDIYDYGIKKALKEYGLAAWRADDIVSNIDVMCKICQCIQQSRFGIVDITGWNPNVLFELGLLYGCGKEVLIIKRKIVDVPTDLRGLEYVEYENSEDVAEGVAKFFSNRIPKSTQGEDKIHLLPQSYPIPPSEFKNHQELADKVFQENGIRGVISMLDEANVVELLYIYKTDREGWSRPYRRRPLLYTQLRYTTQTGERKTIEIENYPIWRKHYELRFKYGLGDYSHYVRKIFLDAIADLNSEEREELFAGISLVGTYDWQSPD